MRAKRATTGFMGGEDDANGGRHDRRQRGGGRRVSQAGPWRSPGDQHPCQPRLRGPRPPLTRSNSTDGQAATGWRGAVAPGCRP